MFSKNKRGKTVFVVVAAFAVIGVAVFVSRGTATDSIDEKILYVSTHNGTISESEKQEMLQKSLEERLQESINSMDGIVGSKVMLDDEHAVVEMVISSEVEFTEDMENDVKDFVQRSSSVEETEIVVSAVMEGE